MTQKTETISARAGPEVKMANTKPLTESGLFLNALSSVRRPEEATLPCKFGRNNVQRHSYVFTKYVPDFENCCYRLRFQCEHCGDEVFDEVIAEHKGKYNGWKQTGTLEVVTRYSKKEQEVPVVSKEVRI